MEWSFLIQTSYFYNQKLIIQWEEEIEKQQKERDSKVHSERADQRLRVPELQRKRLQRRRKRNQISYITQRLAAPRPFSF